MSVISALAVLILFFLPRIPQPLTYHSFADQRTFLHLHNTLNVLSNVPFLVVGVFGLRSLLRAPARQSTIRFSIPDERWSYILFFLGALLTGFGSGYYHFAPSNNTLVWDRLPMTMAFLSFLAASISERIRLAAGCRLLPALVAFGIASIFYWQLTERQGYGDLRPYLFAQFFPLLIIPVMILLFPPRYTRSSYLLFVFVAYTVAKVVEYCDKPIYAFGQFVSGHTLKHLFAALATYWILRMLILRTHISDDRSAATRAARSELDFSDCGTESVNHNEAKSSGQCMRPGALECNTRKL